MNFARQRMVFGALSVLILAWVFAGTGFWLAGRMKVTPEKVIAFLQNTRLANLEGKARQAALDRLAKYMIRLSPAERRDVQLTAAWRQWLEDMTDTERVELVEATLPSGIQQMLSSFEELPEERRLRTINEAYKRLKDAREQLARGEGEWAGEEDLPELSPELQERLMRTGLQAYYTESSAQTKAEMAPLLEEIQRSMESGRMFRPDRPRPRDRQPGPDREATPALP